jgi:hypothetical protein
LASPELSTPLAKEGFIKLSPDGVAEMNPEVREALDALANGLK